jgi:hypothetical protein
VDQERSGAAVIGRWVGWLVVVALAVAVAVATVAVVGQVTDGPLTRAAAPLSAAPPAAAAPALVGPTLPDVLARPVSEARPALEQAGATVQLVDAGGTDRPVADDWLVCAAGAPTSGSPPPGLLLVAALPTGEPCP